MVSPDPFSAPPKKGPCRGVTLIEIMVAIGIIVVLSVLLFPAAKGSLERSQVSKCIANLRQIGAALHSYSADYNGFLLPRALTNASGTNRFWTARLLSQGYLSDPAVLYCPTFEPNSYLKAKNTVYDPYKSTAQTYGMRLWVASGLSWSNTEEPQPLASIQKPSEFFLVADSYWDAWKAQGYSISPGESGQRAHLRHNLRANAVFADGHVEAKDANYFTNEIPTKQGAYGRNKPIPVWPTP